MIGTEIKRNPEFWERQSQTILVTGAYTPLGQRIVTRLAQSGWGVRILTPVGRTGSFPKVHRVFEFEGSLSRISDLTAAIQDCSRVLHLDQCSLSRDPEKYQTQNVEYTRNLVHACKQEGISQFVFLSSSSVDLRKPTRYGRSKKTAEDVLRGSGLPWIILRPSLIVGQDGSEEYRWLRMAVRRFLWIPLPEGGHAVKRPIHEDDLARAIDQLFHATPATVSRRTYHLSGQRSYTTAEIIDLISQEHHLPRRKILGLPKWLCHVFAKVTDSFFNIPFEMSETLRAMVQDADHDAENAYRDFHFLPSPLEGRLTHSNQTVPVVENHIRSPFLRTNHGHSLVRGKRK